MTSSLGQTGASPVCPLLSLEFGISVQGCCFFAAANAALFLLLFLRRGVGVGGRGGGGDVDDKGVIHRLRSLQLALRASFSVAIV